MSVAIAIVPLLILVVLALGVLVYFICYKAAINRKLRAEESGAHMPMASTESVLKVVVIIGVIVMYCSLNSKIMNLQSELQNTTNRLYDEIREVRYELDEMQEAAKKEASMFSQIFYDFGEIDTKNHTVEMTFLVIPKSYSEATEVSINYRGEKIALVNKGRGNFSGSQTFSLYEENWEMGMISVTENGVTRTEEWEETPMGSMLFECLPQLVIMSSTVRSEKRKGTLDVEGEFHIVPSEKAAAPFQAMTLYVKKGDEVIDEMPMNDGRISFNCSYPIEKGDRITMYVTGVDEYGYLHESNVSSWSNHETSYDMFSETYETIENRYRIYTPDGRELTQ